MILQRAFDTAVPSVAVAMAAIGATATATTDRPPTTQGNVRESSSTINNPFLPSKIRVVQGANLVDVKHEDVKQSLLLENTLLVVTTPCDLTSTTVSVVKTTDRAL